MRIDRIPPCTYGPSWLHPRPFAGPFAPLSLPAWVRRPGCIGQIPSRCPIGDAPVLVHEQLPPFPAGPPKEEGRPESRWLDDDLSKLSPADLRRVRAFVEKRFINAITPLAIWLQMEGPDPQRTALAVECAQHAVEKVLRAVEEIRRLVPEG